MSRLHQALVLASVGLAAGSGCSWEEGLPIHDLTGTVVLPSDFIERTVSEGGLPTQIVDRSLIGPVYLGLYAGTVGEGVTTSYPYVATGPVFDQASSVGDAYPYGGTTIGELRSTCIEALQCRVATGRFADYDALLAHVSRYATVTDYSGDPITTGEQLRQTCMAAFDYTTDLELGLVAVDENGDDVVDDSDLDFVEREDGNFEAEFVIWRQEYFDGVPYGAGDGAESQGFTLWGFMDSPSLNGGTFDSCGGANSITGQSPESYAEPVYNVSTMARDVLNRPFAYISAPDVVTGVQDEAGTGNIGYVYDDPDDTPELWLNFQVQ